MDKIRFIEDLRAIMGSLTEEEIKKATEALSDCKNDIYKRSSREKCGRARLLSSAEKSESALQIDKGGGEKAMLRVFGATLLSSEDYLEYAVNIPECGSRWWLYDKCVSCTEGRIGTNVFPETAALVRPILITENAAEAGLTPGKVFYTGDEQFCMISESIAVRAACLPWKFMFNADRYEETSIAMCVDGWYARLIRKSGKENA